MSKFKDFNIEFGGDLAVVRRFLDIWKPQNRAGSQYQLTTYNGLVNLVKAKDMEAPPTTALESKAYGWEEYITYQKVSIYTVPQEITLPY